MHLCRAKHKPKVRNARKVRRILHWCPGGEARALTWGGYCFPNVVKAKFIRCPVCNRRLKQKIVLDSCDNEVYFGVPRHKTDKYACICTPLEGAETDGRNR